MSSDDARTKVPGREKRTSVRYHAVDLTWFKTLGVHSEASTEGISKMCDLSEAGIGLHLTQPLPVGELIFIEIASGKLSLSAVGRVMHQRETARGRYRIGVHFEVVPPNDRMALAKYFAKRDEAP